MKYIALIAVLFAGCASETRIYDSNTRTLIRTCPDDRGAFGRKEIRVIFGDQDTPCPSYNQPNGGR